MTLQELIQAYNMINPGDPNLSEARKKLAQHITDAINNITLNK